jgi:hypothetical protein
MRTHHAEGTRPSLVAGVGQWIQDWGARRARRMLFVEHGRCELEVVSRDHDIAPEQLLAIARKAPETADLLRLRLATLGMDVEALARSHPQLVADMQARCRLCDSKGACTWDLAQDPARGAWRHYCENAPVLDRLAA